MFVRANQHLLGPTASGNQAHSGFHQSDVRFRSGLNLRRVQAHFAAAPKRHPLRRRNHRFWSIFDRQIDVLKLLHRHVQLVPFLFLCCDEYKHQIRANRKIHRLVRNHHGIEIRFQPLQPFVHHGDQIRSNGIHLGVKFAANHAVPKVNKACPGILLDFASCFFQRFQDNDASRLFDFLRPSGANIKNRCRSLFGLVETFTSARKHLFDNRRNRSPFFLHLRCERLHANRVHHFERPKFPAKAPAHRTVHIYDAIGNFRHAPRRIQAHLRKPAPNELLRLVAFLPFEQRPNQCPQPFVRIFDGFAHFQRSEFRLLPRPVFHRLDV